MGQYVKKLSSARTKLSHIAAGLSDGNHAKQLFAAVTDEDKQGDEKASALGYTEWLAEQGLSDDESADDYYAAGARDKYANALKQTEKRYADSLSEAYSSRYAAGLTAERDYHIDTSEHGANAAYLHGLGLADSGHAEQTRDSATYRKRDAYDEADREYQRTAVAADGEYQESVDTLDTSYAAVERDKTRSYEQKYSKYLQDKRETYEQQKDTYNKLFYRFDNDYDFRWYEAYNAYRDNQITEPQYNYLRDKYNEKVMEALSHGNIFSGSYLNKQSVLEDYKEDKMLTAETMREVVRQYENATGGEYAGTGKILNDERFVEESMTLDEIFANIRRGVTDKNTVFSFIDEDGFEATYRVATRIDWQNFGTRKKQVLEDYIRLQAQGGHACMVKVGGNIYLTDGTTIYQIHYGDRAIDRISDTLKGE